MPKLSDVVASQREHLESLECPRFESIAFNTPHALRESRVALISSAGLMSRHDANIRGSAADYRCFDDTTRDRDVLINHVSVNFDRSGFAEDTNTVFPREHLKALAEENIIGSCSNEHYSFMGATAPEKMKEHVDALIPRLIENNVSAVCLLPV